MSDSELSEPSTTPAPPDRELEKSLRREVVKAHEAKLEFSVNDIRTASEEKLGLQEGFYKSHGEWAKRSKDVIKDQMAVMPDSQSSPVKPTKAKPGNSKAHTKKRPSVDREDVPRKKQKIAKEEVETEDLSSPLSDLDSEEVEEKPKKKQQKPPERSRTTKPKTAAPKKVKPAKSDSDEQEGTPDAGGVGHSSEEESKNDAEDANDDSESEMSVLLDEEPQPKNKRKQKEPSDQKAKKSKTTKGKPEAELDADQAEIRRLQGWLVKCGIRKLWGKELKPYETPRAKIKHLKEMLAEAGMTGRYSQEKANQIKEARELAADIEAVQEGAERWGADEEAGEEKQDGRPAKRLVRGAKNYDFLSSDGEETD
ncbi:hypothetical protein LTR99_008916 [Exophiala xenobiotica]|uniref:Transcriptional regulator n=1 Tax=Vermiconidia calcicola TaxID=1690605 RepID=A0AAV9Q610_9PEZI|nr:hypothetical protein LTR96_011144 [Exophiala xenobiotica]KAK5533559.1 hypothetical protein LTR25_007425 [Vermiconidia calcicola]KAK5537125.1 hypothetical protein LTR23_007674 [Chaetothyriales sp. CCFEE 6169]KAK5296549.1 hypothetical protein LTR99_008916 [Exophiala xenobiotica]KAK5334602.1 hypothetical protein LTR98_009556 [Exophiala xenobiotica]